MPIEKTSNKSGGDGGNNAFWAISLAAISLSGIALVASVLFEPSQMVLGTIAFGIAVMFAYYLMKLSTQKSEAEKRLDEAQSRVLIHLSVQILASSFVICLLGGAFLVFMPGSIGEISGAIMVLAAMGLIGYIFTRRPSA